MKNIINNLKIYLFSLTILISTNIFSAGKMMSSSAFAKASANRSAFAKASTNRSVFAEASANRSVFANASSDTSSSSSSRSETTSSISSTDLGVKSNTISNWANSTEIDELTPFQKIQLNELEKHDQIGKFPQVLSHIIGSYSEEFSKEATDDLWNALKDRSLDEQTRTERVKNAIDIGANVNNPTNSNEYFGSPLGYSIDFEYLDIVEYLLKNKKTNIFAENFEENGNYETTLFKLYYIYLRYFHKFIRDGNGPQKKIFGFLELLLELIRKLNK